MTLFEYAYDQIMDPQMQESPIIYGNRPAVSTVRMNEREVIQISKVWTNYIENYKDLWHAYYENIINKESNDTYLVL
jgi:chloramphenicol O-acetyltransferase